MDNFNPTNEYRTGHMRPQKSRSRLLPGLLIAAIFFGGLYSGLKAMNISLPENSQSQSPDQSASLAFHQSPTEATQATEDLTLVLREAPESVENIPQQGGLSLQQIYAQTIDSVVSISCTTARGSSSGTGLIIAEDGYIVTNAHVVAGALEVTALLTDGRSFSASLVGSDTVSDLALLSVQAEGLTPAVFGDSDRLQVGDLAVAIGDPLGADLRGTMTDGIISAINRNIHTDGRTMTLIQTNAALNAGNSGGPLLNCYGHVIGINTMKIGDYVSDSGVEGLGFAIPSTTVKEVVDDLLRQGYVEGRPALNLSFQELTALYQRIYRLPRGLYITQVAEFSDAAKKGILPGDVLTAFDGVEVTTVDGLNSLLYAHKAGDVVEVTVFRSGSGLYSLQLTIDQAGKE